MNRYWQKTFQDTVGKTVTGLSDSAARLKQGWADKPQNSPEPSSQSSSPRQSFQPSPNDKEKQHFLRLPLESARKLRWYDREDLSNLVEANLKEKRLLQSTIAALRQVIQDSGLSESSLEAELKERIEEVDKQAFYEEGVASVLLASLQSEAATLRAQAAAQAEELERLRLRLEEGSLATTTAEQPIVLQVLVQPDGNAAAESAPQQYESKARLESQDREVAPMVDMTRANGDARPLDSIPDRREAHSDLPVSSGGGSDDAAMSALLGKLRRVEEERGEYFEEMARLNDLLRAHEHSAKESREMVAHLESSLDSEKRARADTEEAAEARLQELRSRVVAAQSQHAEMLRRAQDICIEAEDRASGFEKRFEKSENRANKAEAELKEATAEVQRLIHELKSREKENGRLEARASAAEGLLADARNKGEAEKGGALSAALTSARKAADEREAELRKAMREGEEKLRARLERLERDNADLRRSLSKADTEISNLEATIAEAGEAESALHQDLQSMEKAVAERDDLEAKAAALEERLDETRSVQGQLANYKQASSFLCFEPEMEQKLSSNAMQIAKELETERARVEDEIVATVRIASSLESRLQAANAARTSAEHAAAMAEKRAVKAEQQIEKEVARRLLQISADESKWPQAAREAISRQAQKLEAVHSVLARLQGELDSEQHNLAAEQAARHSLQNKLLDVEEQLSRLQRESRNAIQRLEHEVTQAKLEVSDWRQETAAAEAELARVSSAHRKTLGPQRTASMGSHGSTPRRGGGSLQGIGEMELANGAGQIDHLYLKNVILKFIVAVTEGKAEQCTILLPAVATLLRASPAEFKSLRSIIANRGSWWPQIPAS